MEFNFLVITRLFWKADGYSRLLISRMARDFRIKRNLLSIWIIFTQREYTHIEKIDTIIKEIVGKIFPVLMCHEGSALCWLWLTLGSIKYGVMFMLVPLSVSHSSNNICSWSHLLFIVSKSIGSWERKEQNPRLRQT